MESPYMEESSHYSPTSPVSSRTFTVSDDPDSWRYTLPHHWED